MDNEIQELIKQIADLNANLVNICKAIEKEQRTMEATYELLRARLH